MFILSEKLYVDSGYLFFKRISFSFLVKGVFPKWSDEKVTGPVADWAVTPVNVSFFFYHY